MVCEVCKRDGEDVLSHRLDVVWPDKTESLHGTWSASLCALCVDVFVQQMARKGVKIRLHA